MSKSSLTQEQLKEVIYYNPMNGEFIWIRKSWNLEGKVAGSISYYGYRIITINKVWYRASRLAWLYTHGNFPPYQVDHINHNRSDDRISNLRLVTNQENQRNRSYTKNSSGHTGVCFDKARNKWKSHIKVSQKLINLGRFNTIEEALKSRKEAEKLYEFHQNHGTH